MRAAQAITAAPVRRIADPRPRGEKRQRILAAGLKLFAEQPYQSVTMDSVAQLADVAKGTLYLYFPSKESLYLGIISSGFEAAAQSHQAAIHPGMSVEERLRRAIATTIEFYDGQRDFLRLLATEEPRLAAARSRLLGGWRERGFNFFHSLIEEGIKAGVLRSTDSRLATLAIFGTIRSVLLFYGEQRPVTELSQDVGHFVLSGLLAPHRNSRRDSTR